MSHLQSLKSIIHLLQEKNILGEHLFEGVTEQTTHPAIFKLIVLIYNLSTNTRSDIQDNTRRIIVILQELTLIIGQLTSFQPPQRSIATFQKYQFYNYCKTNKSFSCLLKKVFGLYPPMDIQYRVPRLLQFERDFCDGDRVGNPNWMLTRSIITKWLQNQERKDIVFSAQMLLSSRQLLNMEHCKCLWDQIWTCLYLWLHTAFLEPFTTNKKLVTWCNHTNQQYRGRIKGLSNGTVSQSEEIILNLVQFVVDQFIFGDRDNDYFKHSAQSLLQLTPPNPSWAELLMLQLIKIVSLRLQHNNVADNYEKLIHQLITEANPKKGVEFEYLLPHLLPKSQAQKYIIAKRLQFWNYGLQDNINEQIAEMYLQQLTTFKQPQQRLNIVMNLSRGYLIQEVIHSDLLADQPTLGQAIIKVILKYPQRIGKKLYSHQQKLSQLECTKNIEIFAKQWDTYYQIKEQGVGQSNFEALSSLLTFDAKNIQEYQEIPQKNGQIYSQMLTKFSDFILSHPQQNIRQVFFNPVFVDYFSKLQESQKNTLWKKWSNHIIQDKYIMQDLMDINPIDREQQQNEFLSEEDICQWKKR